MNSVCRAYAYVYVSSTKCLAYITLERIDNLQVACAICGYVFE